MANDIVHTLKTVALGDENAMLSIIKQFQVEELTATEQAHIHLYLKTNILKSHYLTYLRALLFEHGYGTTKDLEMAFLLMREAASQGNANAIYQVGRHFLYGIGVEQNYLNALQWLKTAATSPYYVPNAMQDLAVMYAKGLGVTQDLDEAKTWENRAAQRHFHSHK